VKVRGDFFTPGDFKMGIAQILQFVFFGGLAISLAGRVFLPEPAQKFIEGNQMAILGGCFLCNIIAGNLLNSGAFEVTYNGQQVWSKIDTGRFPQMEELFDGLKTVMRTAQVAAEPASTVMPESFDAPDL
jgi:selT/selW/selH-like putative selenoprotein